MLGLLLISSCNRTSPADPDNVIPSPSVIGTRTNIPNVRAVKGSELGHLARASRGKGTLFNIWATWCGSCKGEMPIMSQIAKTYASRGLNVILVSVDEPEDQARLTKTTSDLGFLPPTWVATQPLSAFKWEIDKNWKGNIPITLLYDVQGKRRYLWDGPVESSELLPVIEDFLAGKAVQGEKHFELSAGITDPH
jgi:thiol-disulfide isomerase/thioredoxin